MLETTEDIDRDKRMTRIGEMVSKQRIHELARGFLTVKSSIDPLMKDVRIGTDYQSLMPESRRSRIHQRAHSIVQRSKSSRIDKYSLVADSSE